MTQEHGILIEVLLLTVFLGGVAPALWLFIIQKEKAKWAKSFNKHAPTVEGNEKCCDTCKHYCMIDSGYGWCIRNPPQVVIVEGYLHASYPVVPWCLKACGCFEQRNSSLAKENCSTMK
jgi:hypothetical protein